MEDRDEKLAQELLVGIRGSKGRIYLEPNSRRELKARIALSKVLRAEAPNGWFTNVVAALIEPPRRRSAIIERKIVFQRPTRGAPVVVNDRRRAEIAAFMQVQLEKQKRETAATVAQARNQKKAEDTTTKKFDISRSTLMEIWSEFSPRKSRRRSPTK